MKVHLIEQGGRGGVFQHTVALARVLSDHGIAVCIHTASDYEEVIDGEATIEVCGCVSWHRDRSLRRAMIAGQYVVRTLPHLRRVTRPGDVIHVQGNWNAFLAPATLATLRWGGRRRTVLSPHNTFVRSGRPYERRLLATYYGLADRLIVFSDWDKVTLLREEGIDAIVSPLIQLAPIRQLDGKWRKIWKPGSRPVLLFAGQLRPDKRLDQVIRALAHMENPPLLAVVGEDKGALESWQRLSTDLNVAVHWTSGFQALDSFVAAIREADAVICPYERASQSGVLSIAREVGVPTIATATGGLTELADYVINADGPGDFAAQLGGALDSSGRVSVRALPSNAAWLAHREAYALGADDPPQCRVLPPRR